MKIVLPLLLCYVLTTAQMFAVSGGPVFGGGRSQVSTIGTYSGVLVGLEELDSTVSGPPIPGDPLTPVTPTGIPSNALGLFSLMVPSTQLATGAFMLFADGEIFGGTINGSADPDNGQFRGLLNGTFNFTLNTGTTSTAVTASALGLITAKVTASNSFTSTSLARLNGTASLDVNFGQVNPSTLAPIIARTITFTVTGFKQSAVG